MSLERLHPIAKSGSELLHANGIPLAFSILDFWRWGTSDLMSNATRGRLAEFIVATALGIPVTGVRDEWSAWDLTTPEGIKIEVKSAAYLQSWHQERPSAIIFHIPKSRAWNPETNHLDGIPTRQADIYVFALLAHLEKTSIDPLDVGQWKFYVLPTETLNARSRSQHSITLTSLIHICGRNFGYSQLRPAVMQSAGYKSA